MLSRPSGNVQHGEMRVPSLPTATRNGRFRLTLFVYSVYFVVPKNAFPRTTSDPLKPSSTEPMRNYVAFPVKSGAMTSPFSK